VATISRLLKTTGLFCKIALWKRRYSAKETYNFKEPTHHIHPITIEIVQPIPLGVTFPKAQSSKLKARTSLVPHFTQENVSFLFSLQRGISLFTEKRPSSFELWALEMWNKGATFHTIVNVSCATFQWKETFELWALSFETAFENVTPSGIGCNRWIRCVIDEYDADKIIGLFCKRALLKRLYSAKETYDLIDPTHRSHPIISKYLSKAYFVVVSINLYHAYLCAHPVSKYSRLQIGWHWISRWLWKRFQRTRILPMGVTISTK